MLFQGILIPSSIPNNQKTLPSVWAMSWVSLTSYGVRVINDTSNQIMVYDPTRYLEIFDNSVPPPDIEMMRYVSEAISVFTSRHFVATVVLLGIASERLIDVLAKNLNQAISNTDTSNWYGSKYKSKTSMLDKFKTLKGKLIEEYQPELIAENLKDAFQNTVETSFHQIRTARNDLAHPNDRRFTWNEVSGFLFTFSQYHQYINKIIKILQHNPR